MKPRRIESSPQELIAALPVLRQDAPTITGLRAELRLMRRLIALPMVMGMLGVGTVIGIGGLMMIIIGRYPALAKEKPGEPNMIMLVWLAAIGINFGGFMTLPTLLPFWINWRIRGREAVFCDTQLIGDLIDLGQVIQLAGSSLQQGRYAGCLLAWLQRLLPEIDAREAAALSAKQRDFLVGIALTWQNEGEALVLTILRSAPVWGDMETLTTALRISRTAEKDVIRAAAHASLFPLQERLQAKREDAALILSLGIPALPQVREPQQTEIPESDTPPGTCA